jgi:hypothetical protein
MDKGRERGIQKQGIVTSGLQARVVMQPHKEASKEASQTRDCGVPKNAMRRAARPDSLGRLGTGSSLRKERLFRMTTEILFGMTIEIISR